MNKKPKKKDVHTTEGLEKNWGILDTPENRENIGYNKAVKDFDKWLPKEEEIIKILVETWGLGDRLKAQVIVSRLK